MRVPRALKVYIQDHMAGSVAGVRIATRLVRRADQEADKEFYEQLRREIVEDRAELRALAGRLGIRRNYVKEAGARLGAAALGLKPNGLLPASGPVDRVMDLEALTLGVTGKQKLWQALATVEHPPAPLAEFDLERLERTAERQRTELELRRREASRESFSAG